MADIVEFSLMESHRNIFYKMPGDGLIFYVKAELGATLGLFDEKDENWSYLISIEGNRISIICSATGDTNRCLISDFLSIDQYKRFWITLYGNCLRLGAGDSTSPVIVCYPEENSIKYVSFFGKSTEMVHWKVLLPRRIEKPLAITINKGTVRWVAADNQLPDGSLIGGFENECLYIIRSKHRGSLTPGKFVPSLGVGFIPWGGQAHEKDEFEVLCGFDCVWVKTRGDEIPVEAVKAGHSEGGNSEVLFVGRAKHEGFLIPGKVQPSHRVCYIPFEGTEVAHEEYEILIRPFTNKYAADDHYHSVDSDIPNQRDVYGNLL